MQPLMSFGRTNTSLLPTATITGICVYFFFFPSAVSLVSLHKLNAPVCYTFKPFYTFTDQHTCSLL